MQNISDYDVDSLLAALINGEEVGVGSDGETFSLPKESQRKALQFYSRQKETWQGNVGAREVDDLLKALEEDLPAPELTAPGLDAKNKSNLRLAKIEAHRFGGLHAHCDAEGRAPPIFEFDLDYPLVVIEGFNGAGKSSLLSAITWCLTGQLLRSQDTPKDTIQPMKAVREASVANDQEQDHEDDAANSSNEIDLPPPVVPVPTEANLAAMDDKPEADTWVELTFIDSEGGEKCVKRSLKPTGKAYRTKVEGLEDLGLSDLAIQVGTIMPAIASQMRFSESKTLSDAVAELTGLAPLVSLGSHVDRLRKNHLLAKHMKEAETLKGEKENRISEYIARFAEHKNQHPALNEISAPPPIEQKDFGREFKLQLEKISTALQGLSAESSSSMSGILGVPLNLKEKNTVTKFIECLSDAVTAVSGTAIKAQKSNQLLIVIREMTEDEVKKAYQEIEKIVADMNKYASVHRDKTKARRIQLYVAVSKWHLEHHGNTEISSCPVCSTDLSGVPKDALLDKDVKEALNEMRSTESYLAKSIEIAGQDFSNEFFMSLSGNFRRLAEGNLPETPKALIRRIYVSELFSQPVFQIYLTALKKNSEDIWNSIEANLPAYTDADVPQLPDIFSNQQKLIRHITNVLRAISFSAYFQDNENEIKTALEYLLGKGDLNKEENMMRRGLPIRTQLAILKSAVESVAPIAAANNIINDIKHELAAWEEQVKRRSKLEEAVSAVEPFLGFSDLVRTEVESLRARLDEEISGWTKKLYSSQNLEIHNFGGIDDSGGKLQMNADIGGVKVPAHDVLNASAFRAFLWSFMFSLYKHVREKYGDIGVFLLDDPQSLFDKRNAKNLAASVPSMVEAGMRPIITSNSFYFLHELRYYCSQSEKPDLEKGFMRMSSVGASSLVARLAPQRIKVDRLHSEWKVGRDDLDKSQDFVNETRIYLESRLLDLLASDLDPSLPRKPTLNDFLGRIRALHSNGLAPFNASAFGILINHSDLQANSEFYDIMNQIHHGDSQEISPNDAAVVSERYASIRKLIDDIWVAHAQYAGRLSADEEQNVDMLTEIPMPESFDYSNVISWPKIGSLAARENALPIGSAEGAVEVFALPEELGAIALYGIRSQSLELEVLKNQTVIVSLDEEAEDGDLIIGLQGDSIFARRLAVPKGSSDTYVLESSRTSSNNVPPTHLCRRHTVKCLPVMGVLFDRHQAIEGSGEAALISQSPVLSSVSHTAAVKDNSAYPVARDGDTALLSEVTDFSDSMIPSLRDQIVAVEISDPAGTSFGLLKRIGPAVPGQAKMCVLNNVGSSIVGGGEFVLFPDNEAGPAHIPSVRRLWKVEGFIFRR